VLRDNAKTHTIGETFIPECILPITPAPYTKAPDELIRSLLRAGWSQEDIASAIGATQPTVSRILSGRHKDPRYRVVEALRHLVSQLDEFTAATP